jgi:hypothetical protein
MRFFRRAAIRNVEPGAKSRNHASRKAQWLRYFTSYPTSFRATEKDVGAVGGFSSGDGIIPLPTETERSIDVACNRRAARFCVGEAPQVWDTVGVLPGSGSPRAASLERTRLRALEGA